jgi:hypothetical protein
LSKKQWSVNLFRMTNIKDMIKGKGAVGLAIAFFSLRGMVSLPIVPCDYNLIYEADGKLHRIKVISCSYKSPYGVYNASIRNMGGNMPHQKVKEFDPESCEYVFIVNDELEMYNIPSSEINSKRQISLNTYAKYKVNFGDVV